MFLNFQCISAEVHEKRNCKCFCLFHSLDQSFHTLDLYSTRVWNKERNDKPNRHARTRLHQASWSPETRPGETGPRARVIGCQLPTSNCTHSLFSNSVCPLLVRRQLAIRQVPPTEFNGYKCYHCWEITAHRRKIQWKSHTFQGFPVESNAGRSGQRDFILTWNVPQNAQVRARVAKFKL